MTRPGLSRRAIWLGLSDQTRIDALNRLAQADGLSVIIGDWPGGHVDLDIIILDDAHLSLRDQLPSEDGKACQLIILAADHKSWTDADFALPDTVSLETLTSVYRAARDFQHQVSGLRREVAQRKSAIGTIQSGKFSLRTLEEARNLATMLALACPRSDMVAVGLQELLINAVEHGNLEITGPYKQELLMNGGWRREIEDRLNMPRYADREVIVSFSRGHRMISITIQDDGPGFDHEALLGRDMPTAGYRGRGIALARDLAFDSVNYMGTGNIVEAILVTETKNPDHASQ